MNLLKNLNFSLLLTLGILLFPVSGILGYLYFTPLFWQCLGAMLVILAIILIRVQSRYDEVDITAIRREVERLKKDGEPIAVDLQSCKIKSGYFVAARASLNVLDETSAFDIVGDKQRMKTSQEQAAIIFDYVFPNGKKKRFFAATCKNKKTLELLCASQGSTTLYVDQRDRDIYYFDLEFLEQSQFK